MSALSKILEDVEIYFLDRLMAEEGAPKKKMTDKQRITFLQDLIWKLHYDATNEKGSACGKQFHKDLVRSTDASISTVDS